MACCYLPDTIDAALTSVYLYSLMDGPQQRASDETAAKNQHHRIKFVNTEVMLLIKLVLKQATHSYLIKPSTSTSEFNR